MLSKDDLANLDEVNILTEEPIKARVGKKEVLIRQLTLGEYLKFSKMIFKMYLNHSESFLKTLDLLTKPKIKIMEQFIVFVRFDNLEKDIIKILNKLFPSVGRKWLFKKSYLEKNLTPTQLFDMVSALYLLNFGAVKKKFNLMMKTLNLDSQNLMSTSKKSSDGNQDKSLKPRFTKLVNMEKQKQHSEGRMEEINLKSEKK